jgi:hydroxymethylglutaryl-CoA lyase
LQVLLSLKTYGANKIIECPRDAMQGIKPFIPTERKVAYIQSLLRVGFDSIDFGSFVSPKAIPQMQDTGFSTTRLVSNNQ